MGQYVYLAEEDKGGLFESLGVYASADEAKQFIESLINEQADDYCGSFSISRVELDKKWNHTTVSYAQVILDEYDVIIGVDSWSDENAIDHPVYTGSSVWFSWYEDGDGWESQAFFGGAYSSVASAVDSISNHLDTKTGLDIYEVHITEATAGEPSSVFVNEIKSFDVYVDGETYRVVEVE